MTTRERVLRDVLQSLTDRADRIGGDGYGMPECPWCGADGSSDETDLWHSPECPLPKARAVLAPTPKPPAKPKRKRSKAR